MNEYLIVEKYGSGNLNFLKALTGEVSAEAKQAPVMP